MRIWPVVIVAALAVVVPLLSQTPPAQVESTSAVLMSAPAIHLAQPPGSDHRLAIQRLGESTARLEVTSPAFKNGQPIPLVHSDYDENVSPALAWRGAPAKVASFVVIVEDPDAAEPAPFVHWLVYNIPPFVLTIDEARSGVPELLSPEGALQGRTSRGSIGYFGPRPPIVDPPHHYHVQVFALDTMVRLDPGVDSEKLLEAMRGHVLAAGELVGTFKAPPDAK